MTAPFLRQACNDTWRSVRENADYCTALLWPCESSDVNKLAEGEAEILAPRSAERTGTAYFPDSASHVTQQYG